MQGCTKGCPKAYTKGCTKGCMKGHNTAARLAAKTKAVSKGQGLYQCSFWLGWRWNGARKNYAAHQVLGQAVPKHAGHKADPKELDPPVSHGGNPLCWLVLPHLRHETASDGKRTEKSALSDDNKCRHRMDGAAQGCNKAFSSRGYKPNLKEAGREGVSTDCNVE